MTTRTLFDLVTEEEIDAEHQRALALIREDRDRQRWLRLSFAPPTRSDPDPALVVGSIDTIVTWIA